MELMEHFHNTRLHQMDVMTVQSESELRMKIYLEICTGWKGSEKMFERQQLQDLPAGHTRQSESIKQNGYAQATWKKRTILLYL